MLKIEVIKFEAQDVITASVAVVYTPAEEQKPAECTCNPNPEPGNDYYACSENGHPGCEAEEHHCPAFIA